MYNKLSFVVYNKLRNGLTMYPKYARVDCKVKNWGKGSKSSKTQQTMGLSGNKARERDTKEEGTREKTGRTIQTTILTCRLL